MGTSVTGTSVIGTGVMGTSVTGTSVIGTGVMGTSVTGTSVIGTGVMGTSVTGTSVIGTSVTGTGVTGSASRSRYSSAPQRVQTRFSWPLTPGCGSVTTVQPPQSWPRAGISACSVSTVPQREQMVPSLSPASVQVAAFPATISGAWPSGPYCRSSYASWQLLQMWFSIPCSVQVAGRSTTHSPGTWSRAGIDSVLVSPQRVHV